MAKESEYERRARIFARAEAAKREDEANERIARRRDVNLRFDEQQAADGPRGLTERDGKGRFVSTGLADDAGRRVKKDKKKK